MCGLVALVDIGATTDAKQVLQRMLQTIVHRGPDDSGVLHEGPVALGFRRLSILDLSPLGHQPMDSSDGACTLVFNGEIYNYLELRAELEHLGHSFRSHGDSEVLLAAYRQWGAACLDRMNGMWAFIIYDRARAMLFGARDRFGIKPLYRFQDGQRAIFASEIKAIRASGLHGGRLNLRVCAEHLHGGGLDHGPETFFDGIVQVPAGHAFELRLDGGYKEWSYWQIDQHEKPPSQHAAEAFAELFEDAMRLHMRSDVPVGVNLSGGLDSTSILCAAARIRAAAGASEPLLAFCYQDRQFDESRYIADTLAQTGAQLVPLQMTPIQLWDSLPQVLSFQDEPVHSMTALVGYHLMALARRNGVKVILNGQGADEVIGGYGSYFRDRWAELLRAGRPAEAWRQIVAYTQGHGGSARTRMVQTTRHVAQGLLAGLPGYRTLADRRWRAHAATTPWLRPDLALQLPLHRHRPPFGLNPILAEALTRDPLPLYLRVEDRNSMAHSIEVRLPFLDYRLVQQVFALGAEHKLSGPWNKHVLRRAMTGRIPESVRARVDKMGFPTNAASWFKGPLFERLRDVITDPEFKRHPFFDADVLHAIMQAHRMGAAVDTAPLFDAVQYFLWQRQAG